MDNATGAQAITLTKSDLLAGKLDDNTNHESATMKGASEASSSSFLSEVYNWGVHKAESARNLIEDHPYLTAGIAFAGAVALTKGRVLIEGATELASKESPDLARGVKTLGIPLGLGAALALAGCADNSDNSDNKAADGPKFPESSAADHVIPLETNSSSMSDHIAPPRSEDAALAATTAADDNLIVKNYKNPQDCASDGIFTEKYCKEQWDDALKQHIASVPKFESKEECESKTGKECVSPKDNATSGDNLAAPVGGDSQVALSSNYNNSSSNESGGWFMPYMIGYMVGSSNSRTVVVHDSDDRSSSNSRFTARPLYTPSPARAATDAGASERKEFIDSEGTHVGTRGSRDVAKSPLSQSAGTDLFKGSAASRTGSSENRMGNNETHAYGESEEHFGNTAAARAATTSGVARGGFGGGGFGGGGSRSSFSSSFSSSS